MSDKTAVRLQLTLSDSKTRKPSNFHEWKRRLLADARNVLWLNSDYHLLEDTTLPAQHALIKKLRFIVSLLNNPIVKANPLQLLKIQKSLDDVLAEIAARRQEAWSFVTASVSLKSMEKLERSNLEELLQLRQTSDCPGLLA